MARVLGDHAIGLIECALVVLESRVGRTQPIVNVPNGRLEEREVTKTKTIPREKLTDLNTKISNDNYIKCH